MTVEAGLTRYEQVNEQIKKELESHNKVTVKDVNGQRYIGCALDAVSYTHLTLPTTSRV